MTSDTDAGTPQSPEVHDEEVREELDQELVTHQGDYRHSQGAKGDGERGRQFGALEDEVVPIVPPMSGPADVIGEKGENAQGNESGNTEIGEETLDPRDLLTPG